MLCALTALFFFQATDLIKQIDRLAAAEPVSYGIDTRIRTAEVLASKYPRIAQRELRDAEAALPGVLDSDYRNVLRVRITAGLAPLDFVEAERVAKTIPPERKHDRLAQAYDELCSKARNGDRIELLLSAFHSGAFRVRAAQEGVPPDQAVRVFGAVVDAFPADSADEADINYLLDRTEQFLTVNRQLVLAAIQKIVSAADQQPKAVRSAARFRAAGLLHTLGAEPPQDLLPLLAEPEPPKAKPVGHHDETDFSTLPYAEALEQSLKLEDASQRVGNLIELSRREDLTAKQQARVAAEALSAANEMPLSEDRLLGLSMLSRDFAKRHEMSNAALAAQMLAETYGKVCECGAATCSVNGQTFECVNLVNDYAEYLDELSFTQQSLGLNNISLEARLLVLKLRKLIGKPSQ